MIITRKRLTALALGLAVAAAATPGFAQRSEQPLTSARENALRECNGEAVKYSAAHSLSMHVHTYRSCMMQSGESE
jgi:hypothetical protein